jgi:hypothetical protein
MKKIGCQEGGKRGVKKSGSVAVVGEYIWASKVAQCPQRAGSLHRAAAVRLTACWLELILCIVSFLRSHLEDRRSPSLQRWDSHKYIS